MVKSSAGLEAISRRWFTGITERNLDILPHLLSASDCLRFMGNASGESWKGDDVRKSVSAYFEDVPNILRADELYAEAFAALEKIVASNNGQFVKSLGDRTMSSFPSARSALAAARDIQRALARETQEPRLSVRIGVHTGDVVQAREDFFGTVVNVSARIAALASLGEIDVSEVTRALVGDDPGFRLEAMGSFELAGQSGKSVLYSLDWRA